MAAMPTLIAFLLVQALCGGVPFHAAQTTETFPMPTITIVYDINHRGKGSASATGFSCLVGGMAKTVLFDTGGDGELLLANMTKLGVAPEKLDAIVISHSHRDHLGGLPLLLGRTRQVVTYLPASFPEPLMRQVAKQGAKVVSVRDPLAICEDVFSSGAAGSQPREQSLVLRTARGLVVVTGCAHPGVERIVREAKERYGGEVLLVVGGFHLAGSSREEVEQVVAGLQKLGVRHVAPCHCTGRTARILFSKAYGSGFIPAGIGTVIVTERLQK